MSASFSTFGLAPRQMAALGLLHPYAGERWGAEERRTFELAASEIWRAEGPLSVSARPALNEARATISSRCSTSIDGFLAYRATDIPDRGGHLVPRYRVLLTSKGLTHLGQLLPKWEAASC